jgi:hypothetical protein
VPSRRVGGMALELHVYQTLVLDGRDVEVQTPVPLSKGRDSAPPPPHPTLLLPAMWEGQQNAEAAGGLD